MFQLGNMILTPYNIFVGDFLRKCALYTNGSICNNFCKKIVVMMYKIIYNVM